MIILGSKALLFRLPQTEEVLARDERADYDVIMTFEEFVEWHETYNEYITASHPRSLEKYKVVVVIDGVRKVYEIELANEGSSAQLLIDNKEQVTDHTVNGFLGESFDAIKLEYQMLTKRSHLIYPVHFEKNIADYELLKSLVGEHYVSGLKKEYYDLRLSEAKERYNQRTPNLNVTTEDFFSSSLNVPHYFVHDHIHEVMAHHEIPVFSMIQKDPSKAWCDKDLFFDLPYEYQVQCVQEEAYVIALERYIVPQYGDDWMDYKGAYDKAVKRICTTLTSGWFRTFAIDNYGEIMRQYNPDFVKIFKSAVDSGEVHLIEGKTIKDLPKMIA